MAGSTLAIAATAALVLGAPAAGAVECPELLPEVEQRLPGLSSAVKVQVEAVPGGARVRVLDRSGRALDDGEVHADGCAALAEQASGRVRSWAIAHGAWRESGALPLPPIVDVPEVTAPVEPARPAASPPASRPGRSESGLRIGGGAGAGALFDAGGVAPGFEAWLILGPPRQPFWGEASLMLTTGRQFGVDRFEFSWSRGIVLALGGVYRLSFVPLELVAGLQGGRLLVQPVGSVGPPIGPPVDAPQVSSLDGGGYAGLRALLPLGGLNGWLGTRVSAWFVQHRLVIFSPGGTNEGTVPFLGVWFGVGVETGGQG